MSLDSTKQLAVNKQHNQRTYAASQFQKYTF